MRRGVFVSLRSHCGRYVLLFSVSVRPERLWPVGSGSAHRWEAPGLRRSLHGVPQPIPDPAGLRRPPADHCQVRTEKRTTTRGVLYTVFRLLPAIGSPCVCFYQLHICLRFSVRVNNTDVFHVDKRFWTSFRSRPRFPASGPRERAFHSATVIGNYMVVYGERGGERATTSQSKGG